MQKAKSKAPQELAAFERECLDMIQILTDELTDREKKLQYAQNGLDKVNREIATFRASIEIFRQMRLDAPGELRDLLTRAANTDQGGQDGPVRD